MTKQTKKQTVTKPVTKPTAPPKAKSTKSKPVAAKTVPTKTKPTAKPKKVKSVVPTPPVPVIPESVKPVTINPVPAVLIADITELLEELIDTASPKLASTISRLAYVLCEVMPDLQAVSKRADITLCRKNGVTFGWDRQTEAERAVRSGKYQKSIVVS